MGNIGLLQENRVGGDAVEDAQRHVPLPVVEEGRVEEILSVGSLGLRGETRDLTPSEEEKHDKQVKYPHGRWTILLGTRAYNRCQFTVTAVIPASF